MNIRLSVFPTDDYPRLIAYTTEYKIRNSLANQFLTLIYHYMKISDPNLPYQIIIGEHIRYLTYENGRAIERLLDYISHREESRIYGE